MSANRIAFTLFAFLLVALTIFFCGLPLIAPGSPGDNGQESNLVRKAANSEQAQSESPIAGESLPEVIELAKRILQKMESELIDYTADLVKRERISGSLGTESRMTVKIRNKDKAGNPALAAYIKFATPSLAKDREVIWAETENDGQIVAHEGGFKNWTRMTLDPNGTLAMLGNKYPITEIGLLNLVEKLVEKAKRDQKLSQAEVSVSSGHLVGDRECHLVEVRHPEPKEGLEFHLAQIFLDAERMIPLRYAAFLWPKAGEKPPLEEEYTYLNVQMNVGLPPETFDPDNPEYDFP